MNYSATIKALLAKADSTDSTEERDAFNAKAEALMVKWGVTEAALMAEQRKEERPADHIESRRFTIAGPNAKDLARHVAARVAGAFGDIQALYVSGCPQWVAVGYTRDIDRIELYVPRLVEQARTEWAAFRRCLRGIPQSDRNRHKLGFFMGFSDIVGNRVRATLAGATTGAGGRSTGYGLALRDKQDDIRGFMATNMSVSKGRRRRYDRNGYDAGRQAGRRANINAGDMGGRARVAVGA